MISLIKLQISESAECITSIIKENNYDECGKANAGTTMRLLDGLLFGGQPYQWYMDRRLKISLTNLWTMIYDQFYVKLYTETSTSER